MTSSRLRILLLLWAFPGMAFASEAAVALYEKGQYREALDTYERLFASGKSGTEMLFNAGMCCYRLGEYPGAILYFEKALLWKPGCDPCREMRDRASRAAGIERMELPGSSKVFTLRGVASRIDALYAFAIGSLTLSMAIALRLFAKSRRSRYRHWVYGTLLCVALLSMALAFSREWSLKQAKSYILMETAQLHRSPDTLSPAVAELPAGIKVDEHMRIGEWIKVTSTSWETGWMPSRKLKKIGIY